MAQLHKVIEEADRYLNVANVPDYGGAYNGLQLQNDGHVKRIASAVDASEPVIKKAVARGVDLLVVHHGLYWHGLQKMVGPTYRKFKLAMDNNLALYSSHIPLDIHPEIGNNVLLVQKIGLSNGVPFGDFKGIPIGIKGSFSGDLNALQTAVSAAVGARVHLCHGRDGMDPGTVGVVTGGAGSEVQKMAELGIETFITGEGPHWSFPLAEELRVNLIYAGHYATETFGVQALANMLSEKHGVENVGFIDHPTGL
jgi:dinuclear metal center YbgI/SA1388 family protein